MDFNVHDQTGAWVGIVENPTSAIWTRRYQQPSDFEIYLPATAEMLALLADDYYITREDAPEVMVIEHIEITTGGEDGNHILISGRGAESLLERRIIWQQTALSGRVDAGLYRLIQENAISPSDTARALPLSMESPNVAADTINAQYTGTGLLEAVQEICKAYGLGFRAITEDHGIIAPVLQILKGTNRSEGQTANSPVIFSAEFENLLSSAYVMDTAKYKNVALVAGEGEGKARKTVTLGAASGTARREMFVDARDLSSNEGEISDADYSAQLLARGGEKIAECQLTEAFDGEIDTANTFALDVDYTLGDIVTVENEFGIRKNARVAAIMETWDNEGYTAVPTFENVEV